MGIFEELLGPSESIFRNEEVFDFDYVPKLLPYRENQVKEIANCIKPLFDERKPRNVFVFGGVGIGKTASIRWIIRDLEEYSEEVLPIYLNLWNTPSKHAIFSKIAEQIGLVFTKRSTSHLFELICKKVRGKKGIFLALDEIDKAQDYEFLYPILEKLGSKACIALITNKPEFLSKVEPRIISRLALLRLEFKPYSYEEILGILEERVKHGFRPRALPREILKRIAEVTFKRGDVRVGIFLLHEVGRIAERDARKRVSTRDLELAIERVGEIELKSREAKLGEEEKLIISLIRENSGALIGEIFERYSKEGGLSYPSFWRHVKRLANLGLVKLEPTGAGFRGRSSRVWLRS